MLHYFEIIAEVVEIYKLENAQEERHRYLRLCGRGMDKRTSNRKSEIGYYFLMTKDGLAIIWKWKHQTSTALSTYEAEYMAHIVLHRKKPFTSMMNINYGPVFVNKL